MVLPIVIGALGTIPEELMKRNRRLRNQRTRKDYPDYNIKIG